MKAGWVNDEWRMVGMIGMRSRLRLVTPRTAFGVFVVFALVFGLTLTAVFAFKEYPIGDEKKVQGMKVRAVYFQPITMEPAGQGLSPNESDIHLEADIHALENELGFGLGEWIPYLTVHYKLKNLNNGKELKGTFMPMNASDGPHYGANIKMAGSGNYQLTFTIEPPDKNGFLLHTDKKTGVKGRFWRKPIEVTWAFPYIVRKW